jgi:hypothetical protein
MQRFASVPASDTVPSWPTQTSVPKATSGSDANDDDELVEPEGAPSMVIDMAPLMRATTTLCGAPSLMDAELYNRA